MRLQVYTANTVIVFLICAEKVKDLGHKPVQRLRTRTVCMNGSLDCHAKAQQFLKLISANRHVVIVSSE